MGQPFFMHLSRKFVILSIASHNPLRMNTWTVIITLAIVAGGIYFAYWAIRKTLADESGKNRRSRRGGRR